MKSRVSYLLISGVIILSIFTGIFIWQNQHFSQKPELYNQSFNAPNSSKYIPENADLVFHWKLNPNTVPNYIESFQDKASKHNINKQISFTIDSLFKLTSLDFSRDISKWLGDYGSFAVLDSNEEDLNAWIMVLAIKEDINAEKEFDFTLESNNTNEVLDKSNAISTSTKAIISKKINSTESIYFANNKNNLLISPNPKIIQSSLETLDSFRTDTKKKYNNIKLKNNIKDGFLLIEMSPKKILNTIGQEENLLDMNNIDNLISSVNFDKNKLNIEGIISYKVKTTMPAEDINYSLIDIKQESKSSQDFILVDNPKQYFSKGYIHPYQNFIASLIQASITSDSLKLLKILLENTEGNLIWVNNKEWVVLTKKYETSKTKISDILKKENFLSSYLDFQNKNLEIWTKIITDENEKYDIKESIGAILEEDKDTYIWSQNLSAFSNFKNTTDLYKYSHNEQNTDQVNDFNDVLKIHLDEERTRTFLNNFYPYILFKAMLGNKLTPPQNIDISIAVPTINYPDFIKVKINLKTS